MEKYGYLVDFEHYVGKEELVAVFRLQGNLVSVLEGLRLIFPATLVQVNTVAL